MSNEPGEKYGLSSSLMIEITERAADQLERLCKGCEVVGTGFVRLAPDGPDALRMRFDTPLPSDVVIATGEHARVIFDADVARTLTAAVLDVEGSDGDARPPGPVFILRRKRNGDQRSSSGDTA